MHVVCAGDCGVDRYLDPAEDRAGGITLNFAAHARRLFAPTDRISVLSALGDDAEVEVVLSAFEALDLDVHLRRLPGRTSLQLIDVEPSGEKIFVDYHQGVLGEYRVGNEEADLLSKADLVVAPHYRQIDGFFESVMNTPTAGTLAVDFADIGEHRSSATLERYVDRFDIAFAGLTVEDMALVDRLERLARRHDKIIIVTLGASGSMALTRGERITQPAVPVSAVVDTTGAGDTFAAGFLSRFCAGAGLRESLERGALEAASTISRRGGF